MTDSPGQAGGERLRKGDVPTLEAGDPRRWERFTAFALAWNGYEVFGDDLGALANHELERFEAGEPLSDDVEVLRGCLFFEQRRWRHYGKEPDGAGWDYISSVLDALRDRLPE